MLEIRSLEEAQREFSTQLKCEEYLAKKRWPNGVVCPCCGMVHPAYIPKYRKWYCKDCGYQFSVTAGTIFHSTKLPLTKWMVAAWFLCHSPKGCSAKQLERILGVHYETAWSMAHRLTVYARRWARTPRQSSVGSLRSTRPSSRPTADKPLRSRPTRPRMF